MNLSKELINVLLKAKEEGSYYNPYVLIGILDILEKYDPNFSEQENEYLLDWAYNMFSR